MALLASSAERHSVLEDIQGLSLGVLLCGIGVHFLATAGLVTGQTAGLAVLVAHGLGWSFGLTFFVINLPFYAFAWHRLGAAFTIKSLICVTGMSAITELLPLGIQFDTLEPAYAALVFGATAGLGLLALFRHNGSMGGLGVIALMIQDRTGFRAGYVQLATDTVLFAVALAIFPWEIVAWSLLGALVLNLTIAMNHRRDRYIAT